ncbi:hypothetical protein BD560DRAFT_429591 [Blakeslea trispora]|nr:hypothetical protein BD560DRAFT_429591 [Blakeslea trispora]
MSEAQTKLKNTFVEVFKNTIDRDPVMSLNALADALQEKGVSVEAVDKFCFFSVEKNGTKVLSERGMHFNKTEAAEGEDEAVEVVERVDPMIIKSRKRTASGEGRSAKRPAKEKQSDNQQSGNDSKDTTESNSQPLIVPPFNVPLRAWDNISMEYQLQFNEFLKLSLPEKIKRALTRVDSLKELYHQTQFNDTYKGTIAIMLDSIMKNFAIAESQSRIMGVRKNLYAYYLAVLFFALEQHLKPCSPIVIKRYLQSLTGGPIRKVLKKGERMFRLMRVSAVVLLYPEFASYYVLDGMSNFSFDSFVICFEAEKRRLLPIEEEVRLGDLKEQLIETPEALRTVAKTAKIQEVQAISRDAQRIQ